uniref:Uncharacterized protein n=1 Tax=Anopheles melas TaxID=34690 RepID=A0A182U4U4_9DIPT
MGAFVQRSALNKHKTQFATGCYNIQNRVQIKAMASITVFATVLTLLLVQCVTIRGNPVPAKILGKYVLAYQSPGANLHLNPHDDPDEINELSNGIESGEGGAEYARPQSAPNKHYHYRPQYRPAPEPDQYDDNEEQDQQDQQDQEQQQQQQQQESSDYAEDSATAGATHQYMTTYKTSTKHGGGTRYRPSYSDSEEEDDEDTSASEESNAYNAYRAYQGKGSKKPQSHHAGSSATSSGLGSNRYNQHYVQHQHRPKHQEQQQQQQQQQHHHHHHRQQQQQQSSYHHHHVPSAHTSYHPQLIQAYKILHGTPNQLPTSHEYTDDEDGSEEFDEADEDFHSGAAIGAAAGLTSGYGATGSAAHQIIHTKGRAVPISQHVEIETPVPVPYVKKIHVPIPQEVRIKIPHPVLVPVPRPYPVHIPVAQPIAVPDIKEITVPIEKIVPYPVEKKIPVPIEKPVPYPVEKHVPVYLPHPIPVKVPIVKTIIHKVKQQTASGPPLPPPGHGAGSSFW